MLLLGCVTVGWDRSKLEPCVLLTAGNQSPCLMMCKSGSGWVKTAPPPQPVESTRAGDGGWGRGREAMGVSLLLAHHQASVACGLAAWSSMLVYTVAQEADYIQQARGATPHQPAAPAPVPAAAGSHFASKPESDSALIVLKECYRHAEACVMAWHDPAVLNRRSGEGAVRGAVTEAGPALVPLPAQGPAHT